MDTRTPFATPPAPSREAELAELHRLFRRFAPRVVRWALRLDARPDANPADIARAVFVEVGRQGVVLTTATRDPARTLLRRTAAIVRARRHPTGTVAATLPKHRRHVRDLDALTSDLALARLWRVVRAQVRHTPERPRLRDASRFRLLFSVLLLFAAAGASLVVLHGIVQVGQKSGLSLP